MHNKKCSQIEIAVLEFSKAFDTVPHDGLLSKLKHYDIDEKIWLWIYNFLKKNRKQSVVVDGKQSSLIDVVSGVPQGTVLGPLLFLLHINDLTAVVSSKVRLFADDCLIYRNIKNKEDQIALQKAQICLRTGVTHGVCVLTLPSATLCECPGHATLNFSTTHRQDKYWRNSWTLSTWGLLSVTTWSGQNTLQP